MADLLSEVEYGRILGSFTAVLEDFGDSVAPDAIPLTGTVTFVPTQSHVSYVNSDGETASLYLDTVTASIYNGRIIGRGGEDGVTLLASNSNNVSASVLWNARININPITPGEPAPEAHNFLIEVRRGEVASLIDVIKATSRVHNIALFNDAIAEAAAEFWARVESGEFRGNQGPPGPAGGPGAGVPGPTGTPGKSGTDGAPGVGGNIISDGDLESPGFLVSGDYQESTDSVSGEKSARLSNATSRKILLEPGKSYVGTVYIKSETEAQVTVSLRVFGPQGDISRVIDNSYAITAGTWRNVTYLLDTEVGDQSVEIVTQSDGRIITVDHYTLSDNTVVKGLQKELTAAQQLLADAMEQLDADIEEVDQERARLADSLNDLAVVLEDADVDLTEVNAEIADLKNDLAGEITRREDADTAAQLLLDQLDVNLEQARTDLDANKVILDNLDTDLTTALDELAVATDSIETLETVTLPNLQSTLEAATTAAVQQIEELDDRLYGTAGDITEAKANITQLESDISAEASARDQLALDIQDDFAERDTRLLAAENSLSAAFPDGAFDVSDELSRTIRNSVVQYAVSTSPDTPPTTGWSTASPVNDTDQYVWFRSVITYGDDTTSTSSAARLTGNPGEDGPAGPPGADGKSVTILGSLDSEADLPSSGVPGDAYLIGGYLYVWVSGSWSNVGLIQGPEGAQGPPGADGAPRFTWVKYATSATGAGIADDPAGMSYVGLAFNKTTAVESTVPGDYQWSLIKGPKGDDGADGPAGSAGPQGVGITSITPYFRDAVAGSSAPAKPTTTTPTGWSTTEPAWAPNRDLYRVEKIIYTNAAFAYTAVTKIAAYAGINAAMAAANGKNLNTYTDLAASSKPGPAPAPNSSRTVGDVHRNRNETTGEIYAEYQWNGTAWKQVSFGDEVLSSLDVGKVTGGTGAFQQFFADKMIADDATINKLWADKLVAKSAAFNQIAIAAGNILVDPNGLDPALRSNMGGPSWTWDDVGKYWKRPAVQGGTTQYNAYTNTGSVYDSNLLDSGSMYVIKYDLWVDDVRAATLARASIYYRRKDGTTSFVGDGTEEGGDSDAGDTIVAGQWNKVERFWRAPDDAQSGGINFQLINGGYNATEVRIRNPFVGKQAPAVLIEDGAISASKIKADSVAAAVGQFLKIETSQLIATDSIKTPSAVIDKLWADGIVSKVITTSRLTVAPGNLFPDPYFQDDSAWPTTPGVIIKPDNNMPNNKGMYMDANPSALVGLYYKGTSAKEIAFEPGAEYRVRFTARFGGTTSINSVRVQISGFKEDGTRTWTSAEIFRNSATSYKYGIAETSIKAPADMVGLGTIGFFVPTYESGTLYIGGVEVLRKAGSVLIEDGAVNASKINAESVAAAVGEFVKLDVKNLTASSANIDSLVAQRIAAGTAAFQTVNADKIIASTATMNSAVINQIWADGIAAKAITTNKLTVATTNIIPDGDEMITEEQWAPLVRSTTDKPASTPASRTAAAGQGSTNLLGNAVFPVEPGQEYSAEMWIKADKPNSRFYVEVRDAVGGGHAGTGELLEPVANSTGVYFLFNNRIVPTEWTLFRGTWTASAGVTSAKFGAMYFNHSAGTEKNASISIAGISLKPKVGAVLIENGAVSANHISSDSIDTNHLRTNAVSAEKIVAGAVTTDKMTANSINGDRITANTLDAGKITANTITATQIKARTITADEIATRTILAENLVADTITSNEIKARTITSAEILSGTITANELNVSNITANTAMIDGLWVNGLNAKSISATRVVVGSGNGYWNPDFSDKAGHSTYWTVGGGKNGGNTVVIPAGTGQKGSYDLAGERYSERTVVLPGQDYAVGAWVKLSVASAASANNVTLYARAYTEADNGATFKTILSVKPSFAFSANVWYWVEGVVTVPEDCTRLVLGFFTESGYTGVATFSNPSVRIATTATTIAGGTIQTQHMAANSIEGDRIKANTITATEIAANAVTASEIAANSVTTTAMAANSINGNRITAGTLVADKITSGSFTGKTFTGGEFTGSTFTGSTFRTSLNPFTDGGVQIDSAYGIRGWAAGSAWNAPTFQLNPASGSVSITARLLATNSLGKGVILAPTTGTGGGGLYFSDNGGIGPQMAAVFRSAYNENEPEPVVIRGANGGHVSAVGGLSVTGGGAMVYGNIYSSGRFDVDGAFGIGGNGAIQGTLYYYGASTSSGTPRLTIPLSGGAVNVVASSRRYKKNIVDWRPSAKSVLGLNPRTWQHHDSENPDNPNNNQDDWYVGFIAEEVEDLGLTPLVEYGEGPDGNMRPESLNYDRFAAAQQVVLRDHDARVRDLEETVIALTKELETLQGRL